MAGPRKQTRREIARQLEVREAFGGRRAPLPSTEGLVPVRRKRMRGDSERLETHDEVDAWAKGQPWFPRLVYKRFDARWWIFWVRPEVA